MEAAEARPNAQARETMTDERRIVLCELCALYVLCEEGGGG